MAAEIPDPDEWTPPEEASTRGKRGRSRFEGIFRGKSSGEVLECSFLVFNVFRLFYRFPEQVLFTLV